MIKTNTPLHHLSPIPKTDEREKSFALKDDQANVITPSAKGIENAIEEVTTETDKEKSKSTFPTTEEVNGTMKTTEDMAYTLIKSPTVFVHKTSKTLVTDEEAAKTDEDTEQVRTRRKPWDH